MFLRHPHNDIIWSQGTGMEVVMGFAIYAIGLSALLMAVSFVM